MIIGRPVTPFKVIPSCTDNDLMKHLDELKKRNVILTIVVISELGSYGVFFCQ